MTTLRVLSVFVATLVLGACVTANSDSRVTETLPDRASFPVVSDVLDHRCGTLDCHGVTYRNLRIYGREGLRGASTDRPSSGPIPTTVAEYDLTFQSLVSLEPEIMTDVVHDGGAHPERLTFVRKARGSDQAVVSGNAPPRSCSRGRSEGSTARRNNRAHRPCSRSSGARFLARPPAHFSVRS